MDRPNILTRTVQCKKCPWNKSTNPLDIPDGYSVEKHRALSCTIAEPGSLRTNGVAMACHHSSDENRQFCVGWLIHQLGPGNNIPLRIQMMGYKNARDLRTVGPQHKCFEDTLPKHTKP